MLSEEALKLIKQLREQRNPYPDWERKNYEKERHAFDKFAIDLNYPKTISIHEECVGGVRCEWIKKQDAEKLIIFIHGGGFTSGSALARREAFVGICLAANMSGISIDYPLAPEHPYPEGLIGCVNVYKGLLELKYQPEQLHIFGESAGATLALAAALYLKAEDIHLPKSICVFSPVAEIASDTKRLSKRMQSEILLPLNLFEEIKAVYCNENDLRDPCLSPIYGDFYGFPPVMIQVGSEEMLLEDSYLLRDRLEEADVKCTFHKWEGLFHSFLIMPLPESQMVYQEIGIFLKDT